ncbi:MAG: hypothetical protein V4584_08795 [Verrucomicrobiota bacterium]
MKRLSSFLFALLLPLLAACTTGGANSPRSQDAINSPGTGDGPIIEGKRSMKGRILIPPADEGINVRIATSSGEEIKAAWPGWNHAMFITTRWQGTESASLHDRKVLRDRAASEIDPSQEYHIELLTQNHADLGHFDYDILRMSKNDRIVIDASICQVHNLQMKRQIEETRSADAYPESFFPKQKKEFPNDGHFYSGCSSGSEPTWKCPGCSRGYDTWTKGHGSNKDW